MKRNRSTVNLVARAAPDGQRVAPTRFCLWKPGWVDGDFGRNLWDAEAAKSVMQAYQQRGNALPIDVEHNTNPSANPNYDVNNPPEGAGYCWLKLVDTPAGAELWLDPIEWSDYGRQQIESGSRRYLSPDWRFDPKTSRPVQLKAIGLVQNPGTYHLPMLASAKRASADNGARTMDMAMLVAALKGVSAAEDVKASLDALLAELDKMTGEPAPASEELPAEMAGDMPPAQEEKPQMAQAGAKKTISLAEVERRAVAAAQRTYREESEKARLVASAKTSPAYTEQFGQELQGLSLATVKRLVAVLPKAPPAPAQEQATASAAQPGPIKVGPLAGAAPSNALTPKEQESIALLDEKFSSTETVLARASAGQSQVASVFTAAARRRGKAN